MLQEREEQQADGSNWYVASTRDLDCARANGVLLGTYDPIPKPPPFGQGTPYKDIKLDTSRAKYWLGVGAQPSDPVWRLLAMVSLHACALSPFTAANWWLERDAEER